MNRKQTVHAPRSPLAPPHIEAIWVAAAQQLGWRVSRAEAAYATTDGNGTMLIALDESLDPQDAVAQLIFHELCHGLVEGPDRWALPDWGLSNTDDRDVTHEHACLRLQVHLAEPHGLRELMAPTTEYRSYHDEIAGEPLRDEDDPAASLARQAVEREESRPWLAVLDHALATTRLMLDAAATALASERESMPMPMAMSTATSTQAASMWMKAALHPVGFAFASDEQTCGSCAWLYRGGRGRPVERCRQSAGQDGNGRRTAAHFRGCERWEPPVDCQECGACCREAYHSVTISMRDPVVWKQPALVQRNGHRFEILRSGDHCAALTERSPAAAPAPTATPASSPTSPASATSPLSPSLSSAASSPLSPPARRGVFSCDIYEDRPRPCREFEAGGRHCLVARRRVGLSP